MHPFHISPTRPRWMTFTLFFNVFFFFSNLFIIFRPLSWYTLSDFISLRGWENISFMSQKASVVQHPCQEWEHAHGAVFLMTSITDLWETFKKHFTPGFSCFHSLGGWDGPRQLEMGGDLWFKSSIQTDVSPAYSRICFLPFRSKRFSDEISKVNIRRNIYSVTFRSPLGSGLEKKEPNSNHISQKEYIL